MREPRAQTVVKSEVRCLWSNPNLEQVLTSSMLQDILNVILTTELPVQSEEIFGYDLRRLRRHRRCCSHVRTRWKARSDSFKVNGFDVRKYK